MATLPEIEQRNVKKVYEIIASEFDSTRAYHWNVTKQFLDKIPVGSLCADIGCGNGRNMMYRSDITFHGCDITEKFCQICQRKGLQVQCADITDLPYSDNQYSYVICSAVIHHLSTSERRLKAIQELLRITRPGGRVFIQVWAKEQTENQKRQFTSQDNMVTWSSKDKSVTYERFYHVFVEGELELLVSQCNEARLLESFYDVGNWGVILEKNK